MQVIVEPYNSAWLQMFREAAQQVLPIFQENIIAIHHIGSTSIPYIYAKPIIDILLEVYTIHQVDNHNLEMEQIGYQALGEFGIIGRRFFRKHNIQGIRTHHLHIFQTGSADIQRHLAFRDFLIAHPEWAQQYSDLKRELARQYPMDIEAYMDGKDGFIKGMEKQALLWQKQRGN